MDNQPVNQTQDALEPAMAVPPAPKRFKLKKWQLAVGGLLLVVGVGLLTYALTRDEVPEEEPQTILIGAVADEEILANANNNLYFQMANKIIAYDTAKKSPQTLYENLPDGSEVTSLYVGADGWRAYYTQYNKGDQGNQLAYVENGRPTEIITSTELYFVTSDARLKLAAYSLAPIIFSENEADMSSDKNTSRTYVVNGDGSPELVYKSNLYNRLDEPLSDTASALYNVRQISPDGGELLFGRNVCYQCDGGDSGSYAEFDLASKQMSYLDLKSQSRDLIVSYARQGTERFYLHEYPDSIYSGVDGPGQYGGFNLKLSKFTELAKKTLVFQEKNATWNVLPPFSPDYSLVAIEEYKPGNDYASRFFKGLYEVKGTAVANLVPLALEVPQDTLVSDISNKKGDCIGIGTTVFNGSNYTEKRGIAVACQEGSKYKFIQLGETDFLESGYIFASVL